MGFVSDVASKIRGIFANDKEQAAHKLARGQSSDRFPGQAGDLLNNLGYDALAEYLKLEADLLSRYADYEDMDDYPEISAAIDIFADDSTQPNTPINRTVWISSRDTTVEHTLDDLLHKRLRMDEELWEIARTMVKYGNDYEELLVNHEGVIGLNFLPPPTIRRVEGEKGALLGFMQDYKGKFSYTPTEFQQALSQRSSSIANQKSLDGPTGAYGPKVVPLEGWEVVHFRLRSKHRRSVYGFSVLESARWIWKRLMLLEDAALIYRLQRAPERFAFYVDVGDLPPQEALGYLNRVRQQYKKKKWVNPTTGRVDLKFNPLGQDEDFFVPSRKGSDSTRIDVLGAPQWQSMEDIEYFRSKMFAAIKVPKSYLGQDAGTARAVLSAEDVRFARSVLRVQRELKNGIRKICRVHLSALNVDPARVNYDVHMTVPSAVFELAQMEVRNARADLANRMREFVSLHWILSKVFDMSDKDIALIMEQRGEDVSRDQVALASAQVASTAVMSGLPGSEYGPPGAGGAPPAEGGAQEGSKHSPREISRALQEGVVALTPNRRHLRTAPISERELFAGDREAEKRAEDKLVQLLKNDRAVMTKLDSVKSLLSDLKHVAGRRR
jgi:hypothetical protein